jgi:uncharacterized protein YegP (UPF0339 family)
VADKVVIYPAQDGWRWHRVAPNGEVVSESGEAYERKDGAEEAAARQHEGLDVVIEVRDDEE